MDRITDIGDLEKRARGYTPKMFYDYADSGSWSESTYRANSEDFAKIKLRQRVLRPIEHCDLQTEMVGQSVAMPLALAPIGALGMQRADGEILAARAAEKCGVPFTLSTMSICSLEEVSRYTTRPFWFQLYMMRDRVFMAELLKRAQQVGCSALLVTLDLQILAQRHKDIKNGLSIPPRWRLQHLLQLLARPRWCWDMLHCRNRSFGNLQDHVKDETDMGSLSLWAHQQFDRSLTWDDIDWVRERWDGKLILKGILDVEDAKLAASCGADALVVSNHGGRQLDGAPSTICALPSIVEAVADRIEIHFDSGIRCGQDMLKAIALGAKGCYSGRAFLYGLAAGGEQGVIKAIEIMRKELEMSMALCGVTDVKDIDKTILWK